MRLVNIESDTVVIELAPHDCFLLARACRLVLDRGGTPDELAFDSCISATAAALEAAAFAAGIFVNAVKVDPGYTLDHLREEYTATPES